MEIDRDIFAARLTQLREQKGISAHEMSISLGNGNNYINNIENKKYFPKMENFLYICDFLDVSPAEFFEMDNKYPANLSRIVSNIKMLTPSELIHIDGIVEILANNHKGKK